jgi:hypothetical protein
MKINFVRDGKIKWPVCPSCECRLDGNMLGSATVILSHFGIHPERDARGHTCDLISDIWAIDSRKVPSELALTMGL